MKKNHNAIATFALIKKSRRLYQDNKISKLEHMKNMNYILRNMDSIIVDKKQCDLILDVLFVNQNKNDITALVDTLISSVN